MTVVSVVTPSYNQVSFLDECIYSIRNQTRSDLVEHILLDAGSTDGSLSILEKHSDWLKYWHSRPDRGQSQAINEGFRMATGDIMCWINSDDALSSNAAEIMIAALDGIKEPAWAYGRSIIIDQNSEMMGVGRLDKICSVCDVLRFHNHLMQPGVFWNRAMWDCAGTINENLHYVMDFDLWLRFSKISPPICIDKIIGVNRIHEDTKSSKGGLLIHKEISSVIRMHAMNNPIKNMAGHIDSKISTPSGVRNPQIIVMPPF